MPDSLNEFETRLTRLLTKLDEGQVKSLLHELNLVLISHELQLSAGR